MSEYFKRAKNIPGSKPFIAQAGRSWRSTNNPYGLVLSKSSGKENGREEERLQEAAAVWAEVMARYEQQKDSRDPQAG